MATKPASPQAISPPAQRVDSSPKVCTSVHSSGAAIGVSGPTFRLEGRHAEVGALVVEQADRLGRALRKLG